MVDRRDGHHWHARLCSCSQKSWLPRSLRQCFTLHVRTSGASHSRQHPPSDMSCTSSSSRTALVCLRHALRQCHVEQQHRKGYATAQELYPSLQTRYPPPTPGFRPSRAIKQNRTSRSCVVSCIPC